SDKRQRKIVDHLPAGILERVERGRLAGAREAGDEQHALRIGQAAHVSASPTRRSAASTLSGAEASRAAMPTVCMRTPAMMRLSSGSGSRSGYPLRST